MARPRLAVTEHLEDMEDMAPLRGMEDMAHPLLNKGTEALLEAVMVLLAEGMVVHPLLVEDTVLPHLSKGMAEGMAEVLLMVAVDPDPEDSLEDLPLLFLRAQTLSEYSTQLVLRDNIKLSLDFGPGSHLLIPTDQGTSPFTSFVSPVITRPLYLFLL